jgi:hypothetical protein
MNRYIKLLITIAAAAALAIVSVQAEPSQRAQALFDNLMAATISNDYDAFVAQCDARMAAAITKQMLEGVSQQIAPRANKGYEVEYLGELNQQAHVVHLWRVRFKDGKDDVLATLSVKDGKAGGFFLK